MANIPIFSLLPNSAYTKLKLFSFIYFPVSKEAGDSANLSSKLAERILHIIWKFSNNIKRSGAVNTVGEDAIQGGLDKLEK